jgi:hypothetical protein
MRDLHDPGWRDDLLRQISALDAELDLLDRPGTNWEAAQQRRDDLERQIAELWERFLG